MPRQKKQHLKRRKDGRYCCKYHDIQFMGNTEEEALRLRDEYKKQELLDQHFLPGTLFSEYAVKWLDAYKAHLTTAPYNAHVRVLNKWLNLIGDTLLTDITPSDVAQFYQSYNGMSLSTINNARNTIKGMLKAAVADGLLTSNPAESVKPPKGTKGTHRAITPEERELIHKTSHRFRPVVMTMLYAGLRRGEAAALNIDRDVDFEAQRITVREAIRFEKNGSPTVCNPKTEAGIRTVPLLNILAKELKGLHGLLCKTVKGNMITQSGWDRAWESYLNALGETRNGCQRRWPKNGPWVPVQIRAHDLRHSFCTMLYDAGVDLKTAMLWMGHADETMTMQIYTHLTETRRLEAEKALREAEKTLFGMQNRMQEEETLPEPLPINAPGTVK